MRILLIVPPLSRFASAGWHSFHIGLGYIAAVLREVGHDVAIYDVNIETDPDRKTLPGFTHKDMSKVCSAYQKSVKDFSHRIWKEFEYTISDFAPEIVGVTCKVTDIEAVFSVASIAKKWSSECITIVGGPGATTSAQRIAEKSCVDYVVRGEGEQTMLELIEMLSLGSQGDLESVSGLTFRKGERLVNTAERPLMDDLDSLPYPARDLLLYAEKISPVVLGRIMGGVITARGCPYSCTYCANRVVWSGGRVRTRSTRAVVDEIAYLKDHYDIKNIIIWDDTLTMNRQRVVDLCDLLIKEEVDIKWVGFVRPNTIDEDLVRLMKQAGCCELQVGVESGSEKVLQTIKKGVTLDEIRRCGKVLRDSNIGWHAFFMIGFPGETREEMEATLKLMYDLAPDSVLLSVVTPYPGTALFKDLYSKGCLHGDDWLYADTGSSDSVLVDKMSKKQFKKLALRFFRECDRYNVRSNTPYPKWRLLAGKLKARVINCCKNRSIS